MGQVAVDCFHQRVVKIAFGVVRDRHGHAISGGPPLWNAQNSRQLIHSAQCFGQLNLDFFETSCVFQVSPLGQWLSHPPDLRIACFRLCGRAGYRAGVKTVGGVPFEGGGSGGAGAADDWSFSSTRLSSTGAFR